ncbi:MAG TPA: bifunctional 4-hydroxy-2-oxoglutarate aldolase/2-dehydro-3-deoxy-phosphogluconate aldolase [Tepidisphaeraceae bacterium]|nr:bifunctional 4-hydroxy-2-oxoglutarate aldolase/2-dehydro-3-deoxy-phosphogluconate aldolase [Tepidisphaeraceae bacterium]
MPPAPLDPVSTLRRVLDCGVIAVLRLDSTRSLTAIARALLAGGVTNVEVTMTTPGALDGIRALAAEFGETLVPGVGTVLDVPTCEAAVAAGARYVVSPHFDPAVVSATKRLGGVSMPGAFTPTEMLRAWAGGADVVKVFPSAAVGPNYIRDVLAPLPHLRLMPTGGVDARNAADWIRAGAVCVGAGASLVPKDALARGDWPAITANARAFVAAVAAARG